MVTIKKLTEAYASQEYNTHPAGGADQLRPAAEVGYHTLAEKLRQDIHAVAGCRISSVPVADTSA
jgi:hypothetical protein